MKLSARLCLTEDSGVIAPATAVVMAVLIGMVGLVTDTSVWYAQRRQLQGITDAAALAGARFAANDASARTAVTSILTDNGLDPAKSLVDVQTGSYCPNIAVSVSARFQTAGCPDGTIAKTAVKVWTTASSPLFLSRFSLSGNRTITTNATAARVNQAGIEAGSGLASLNSDVANNVLGKLTGSPISLTAVQYDGLLNTKIDALTFLDALAGIKHPNADLSLLTYSSLLKSTVSVQQIIAAEAAVLGPSKDLANVKAVLGTLTSLSGQIAGNQQIALASLFDLGLWQDAPVGTGTSENALRAGLNLWQLTSFSLQIANGNNAVALKNMEIGLGGLIKLKVVSTAIEKPVSAFAFGPEGVSVHTAQIRFKLELSGLNLVPQLGPAVNVPIYVEVASGDARIDKILCTGAPATDAKVIVKAHSGAANVYIGAPSDAAMNNFDTPVAALAITPVKILNLGIPPLVTLADTKLKAQVNVGRTLGDGTSLMFVQPTGVVVQPRPPTATTGKIGRSAFGGFPASAPVPARAISDGFTNNLLLGLASSMEVKTCLVNLNNLCIGGATTTGAALGPLFTVLNPVFAVLDGVLDSLIGSLGIQLGYIDVSVTGVRCGMPVLVS